MQYLAAAAADGTERQEWVSEWVEICRTTAELSRLIPFQLQARHAES